MERVIKKSEVYYQINILVVIIRHTHELVYDEREIEGFVYGDKKQ